MIPTPFSPVYDALLHLCLYREKMPEKSLTIQKSRLKINRQKSHDSLYHNTIAKALIVRDRKKEVNGTAACGRQMEEKFADTAKQKVKESEKPFIEYESG